MRLFSTIALLFLAPACGPVNRVPDAGDTPFHPPADAGPIDAPAPAEDTDASGTDAPNPAEDTPVADAPAIDTSTPEGFARREAELLCEAWERCAGCSTPTGECVPTMTERSLTSHDPALFRPEEVDAYLAALEEALAICQQLTWREYAELFPYRGDGLPPTLPDAFPGDLCTNHDDCTTRNCQPYREPSGAVVNRCTFLPPAMPRGPLC